MDPTGSVVVHRLESTRRFKYLEEAAPEDGDPAGSVEVHELEDVS